MPVTIGTLKNTNYFPTQSSRNTVYYQYFDVQHNNCTNESKNNIIFNVESNESIFIIKVSNPHQILLEHLSWNITQDTIGKKFSSGAFVASCQVYDVTMGNYLNCIMETFDFGWISEVKLQ